MAAGNKTRLHTCELHRFTGNYDNETMMLMIGLCKDLVKHFYKLLMRMMMMTRFASKQISFLFDTTVRPPEWEEVGGWL